MKKKKKKKRDIMEYKLSKTRSIAKKKDKIVPVLKTPKYAYSNKCK